MTYLCLAVAVALALAAFAWFRPRWGKHHRSPRFGPPRESKQGGLRLPDQDD